MKNRPVRVIAVASLMAASGGAQVMAGVHGALSLWEAVWLAGTVGALFAAGLLAGAPADSQKMISGSLNSLNRSVQKNSVDGSPSRSTEI
ncbi:hypothetical protein ACFYOT_21900 [Saccharothrix saharensis]|uniref:hypothetical protein n=1 Tax=Saccharothrix saharensis TaxID=571190 RepID=UPI0036AB4FBA